MGSARHARRGQHGGEPDAGQRGTLGSTRRDLTRDGLTDRKRGRDQLRRLMDMADEMPARQQLEESEDTAPRRRSPTQRYAA